MRKEGVHVEVLEWIGDIKPYGEIQEVWIQILGIPPRWCHWKFFAQVASGFGLMTEVDWSTLFKTFYEVVRVKVACKDPKKIPHERLYELNKKLHLVSFTVESEYDGALANQDDGNDDGGDDDQKGDEEADDRDSADGLEDNTVVQNPPKNDKSGMKTPNTKLASNTGHKTVSLEKEINDYGSGEIIRTAYGRYKNTATNSYGRT